MFGLDAAIIGTIIVAVFTGGVLNELIRYWRDRRKDAATVELTDMQTLQAKLAYMESIHESLQRHNDNLQKDYDELDEKYRRVRQRVSELEEELDRVSRSAAQTKAQCDSLSLQLEAMKEMMGDES